MTTDQTAEGPNLTAVIGEALVLPTLDGNFSLILKEAGIEIRFDATSMHYWRSIYLSHGQIAKLRVMLDSAKAGLQCAFCGKGQDKVEILVAGISAYICNECAALAQCISEPGQKLAQGAYLTDHKIKLP